MTDLTVISLLPSILDTNGDSQNARVLAQRARWSGTGSDVSVDLVGVESSADLPSRVDAIVIGSGTDATLLEARDGLLTLQNRLRAWITEGVPLLAVGTGWELLSWGIDGGQTGSIDGLGILPGRAVPRGTRASDDLVIRSSRFGVLVGYENHARDYVQAEGSPLGRVLAGSGNGRDSGQEGVVMGDAIGTHLHGPVLARNPALADHLLASAFTRAGAEYTAGERAIAADVHAAGANSAVLRTVGITD